MNRSIIIAALILFPMIWISTAESQTVTPIYKVAVGDTLLIYSDVVFDSNYPIQGIDFRSNYDTANFTILGKLNSGKYYYSIYFIPKSAGFFYEGIHLNWTYGTMRYGGITGNKDLNFSCVGISDSEIIFRQYIFYDTLAIDTARELLVGRIEAHLANLTSKQITIDSVQYFGLRSSLNTFALDSFRSGNSVFLGNVKNATFPIYIFSKDGPGYNNVYSQAIIYEHLGNKPHSDTLQFILSSPPYCCQLAISPIHGLYFRVSPGQILDTTLIISYTRFVNGFSFSTLGYPFSTSIEDQPFTKILHIRCQPSLNDSSEGLYYYYQYITPYYKLFNGEIDSSFNNAWEYDIDWAVEPILNIPTTNVQMGLQITPNPASNIITVSLADNEGSYDIAIFSSTGNLVKTLSINSFPSQINISGLSSGTYYLQAGGKQRTYYQKFIVE